MEGKKRREAALCFGSAVKEAAAACVPRAGRQQPSLLKIYLLSEPLLPDLVWDSGASGSVAPTAHVNLLLYSHTQSHTLRLWAFLLFQQEPPSVCGEVDGASD